MSKQLTKESILGRMGLGYEGRRKRRSVGRSGGSPVRLEALESRQLLAIDLRIAEVVVDNRNTLDDEDGVSSDWFEVYNAGTETVNLNGYHVTDDIRDRTKWTFPDVSVKPGANLVVFASEKDRTNPEKPLHTNFKLSEGDYLGLFKPDGVTVLDAYNVLPAQYEDISYGISQTLQDRSAVTTSGTTRVLLPTSAAMDVPVATWTSPAFDASAWSVLPNGIGYDTDAADGDYSSLIAAGGNVLSTMRGKTASAYVRNEFTLPNTLPTFKSMEMTLNYDDGYIAYLNGTEISRGNGPATAPNWSSKASAPHGGTAATLNFANFGAAEDRDKFTLKGNATWGSNRLQLTPPQANQVGAAWTRTAVPFGSDYTFETSMVYDIHSPGPGNVFPDADGIGGEGMTFVLQGASNNLLGGGGGALGLDNSGAVFLAIELDSVASGSFDPDNSLASHLGIDTSVAGNVARVAVPRFNGNSIFPGQPGPGTNFVYLWVKYTGSTKALDVFMSTTSTKPDTPTLTTNIDLYNLFSGTPELFMGWTAATSAAYNGHDVVSWNVKTGVGELGSIATSIDVSQYVSLLKPGKNVLAVHGLNVDANDKDFLLISQLATQEVTLGDTGYFLAPTPKNLNGQSTLAPSGSVTFSKDSSLFVDPFTVTISPPSPGAKIYFTTDGTVPSETSATSTLYTGPIAVNGQLRIRARAVEAGRSLGPITTVGYTQLDPALLNFDNDNKVFNSNLPLIVFDAYGQNPDSQSLRMVPTVSWFIEPGANGRASLADAPMYTGRAGLRIRGQSSEGWPKHQYAMELWEEGNDDSKPIRAYDARDKDVPLFGMPADSDWVLNGPYSDKTQLNNFLTFNWYRELGLYAPRARLVEVFVNTTKGAKLDFTKTYRGTYVLLEKIKISSDRVDINKLQPGDNTGAAVTGGYIWKKDKSGADDVVWSTAIQKQELRIVEPQKPRNVNDINSGEITTPQLNYLKGYINEFEAALYGPNFTDPNVGYQKYIDVNSWVDTWLMVEMTKNIDGFRLSTYYHKDINGKIKQGPAWDYNLSLGNGNYLKGSYPQGWYKDGLGDGDYPYWRRLFEDPNFAQRVADRWQELRATIFKTEEMIADIDRGVKQLTDGNPNMSKPAAGERSNPISRNYRRWTTGSYGESLYHWPNCFFGVDDCPASPLPAANTPNGRPNSYDDYIYIMKWFVTNRLAWMDTQFTAPVVAAPGSGVVSAGTKVTLTAPAGYDVYYTLDGTDPRDPLVTLEEKVVLPSGSPGLMTVPKDGSLMTFCTGPRLTNVNSCFMNSSYPLDANNVGANGETWSSVTLPVGYDVDGDYNALIKTDISSTVKGVNASSYLRIPFTVDATTAANASSMKLSAKYDDGFVAYLWFAGANNSVRLPVEIARANAPGVSTYPITPLDYNASATQTHLDADAVRWADFDVTGAIKYLRTGTNYLYVQMLNESAANNDMLMDFQLTISTKRTELAPGVIKYTGPITVDQNSRVFARGLNAAKKWSGKVVANYVVDSPVLALTELNYNPYAPTAAELAVNPLFDKDDFEFIELKNTGSKASGLVGLKFTGVDATLANVELGPGGYGVVVKNTQAFRLRYGADAKILGQFTAGSLSNNGERITVSDLTGKTLLDFTYGDTSIWPQSPDGSGGSLELKDPNFTAGDQYSKYYVWRGSTEYGGSPGKAGIGPLGIVINEVLSSPGAGNQGDAIELFNSTSQAINIGGWYLSDAASQLLKYQIPANITLGPGQYLVITEQQFNANPNTGFGLSGPDGDNIWLTVAVNGKVTQMVDDVHFGGSVVGESFGRVPNATGLLTPLSKVELGAVNTVPRVGPLIISELNYNSGPPTTADLAIDPNLTASDLEFIEIHNPTTKSVNLLDWRIRGGVEINFAPGEQLLAGETAIVISFNPANAANAKRLAAFKNHFKLGNNVKIFGGYSGKLSNIGERVTLLRAEIQGTPGTLAHVIEDEVVFDDRAPWPSATNGGGRTLNRKTLTAYGNSADSWAGFDPTPGVASFGAAKGDFNGDNIVNAADINLLFVQLRSPSPDPNFDLTGDRVVDTTDRDYLIKRIIATSYGDANLNGVFDSTDLIQVFQVNQYEDAVARNSVWETGDWNGDGDFNTSDLVLAFQDGGYVSNAAARGAAAAMAVAAALDTNETWNEADDMDEWAAFTAAVQASSPQQTARWDDVPIRSETSADVPTVSRSVDAALSDWQSDDDESVG